MKMEQTMSVPKLRFSEFTESWETNELSEVFRIGAGGDIDKERLSKTKTDDFPYPVFANAETDKGFYGYASYYKEEGGCVTVSGRGNLGTPHARHERFVPIVRLLVLRPRAAGDVNFFESAISRIPFFIESTGVPQLTGPQIGGYSISSPFLPEQRKIANFLTAVDGRLAQLSQKKALLEAYKKGVMQQLFTQALRFQDDHGNEFPDWEETTFGTLGKFIGGGTPSKSEKKYWSGSIPWVSSSDLVQESITQIRINRFITSEAIAESATKLVPKGSVLIVSRVGVGKAVVAPSDLCTSQDFTSLIPSNANPYFVAYFLKFSLNKLLTFNQGTSIQGFTKEDISGLEMGLPCQAEQTKIANFLTALDRKIETVAAQITHTQTFKRGLLQQMFV